MRATLDHRELYRLPWSAAGQRDRLARADEEVQPGLRRLLPRERPPGHKTLAEVRRDLDVFSASARSTACRSRAATRSCTRDRRDRPDGRARRAEADHQHERAGLTEALLGELKEAGLVGFTFHIDSKQGRPRLEEQERDRAVRAAPALAEMVAAAGGIGCSFNATVYEDTLQYVPEIVEWAQNNIDIVNTIVFIAFRAASSADDFDHYVKGEKVDFSAVLYCDRATRRRTRSSRPRSSPRSESASRTSPRRVPQRDREARLASSGC